MLPHLANVDLFKERIWKSYFKANQALYDDLLAKYRSVRQRLKDIEAEAATERTQWESAIDLFNDRFFVPFKLEAKNKAAVCLAHEPMLDLTYTFKDGQGETPVGRDALMKSLSQGEKKALYILNIIFEIEVRRRSGQETLFVVDDIADSFDYKNKYAIIQYLQEISDGPVFKQIILTHNFDFFRTISSRFVGYAGCLMATKTSTGITLSQAEGIKNIFVNDWKGHFFSDKKKRIASIPFMRNLIEYVTGKDDDDYLKLTCLLHWKDTSAAITQNELNAVYIKLFGLNGAAQPADDKTSVIEAIQAQATECLQAPEGINFENKIVLSVAIRLAAEKFMVEKIADDAFWRGLGEFQTHKLMQKFKELFGKDAETIKILNGVSLMTPENIHLNAFMYEPILDMSDSHLKKLYRAICDLK